MNAVSISQPIHSPTPATASSSFPPLPARLASQTRLLCDSFKKYCLRSGLWKNAWRIAERKHVWERLRRGRIATWDEGELVCGKIERGTYSGIERGWLYPALPSPRASVSRP